MSERGISLFVHTQAMDELDLSAFRYGGANFTGFRLVDRENSQRARNVQTAWTTIGAAYHKHLPAGGLLKVCSSSSSSS